MDICHAERVLRNSAAAGQAHFPSHSFRACSTALAKLQGSANYSATVVKKIEDTYNT